jgi:hypothetical protein
MSGLYNRKRLVKLLFRDISPSFPAASGRVTDETLSRHARPLSRFGGLYFFPAVGHIDELGRACDFIGPQLALCGSDDQNCTVAGLGKRKDF